MATMKLENGATITLSVEELQSLFSMAVNTSNESKRETLPEVPANAPKPKPKKTKREYDAVLDSKRVGGIVKRATANAAAAGFDCKTRKQGKWVWLYPTDGKGRTPEFKALKLAKGWKYSPKRGAFYRDFS